jgi:hypothetical protein
VHGRQQELIDLELLKMGGWLAAEMTPHLSAPGVNMPVLMIQVLRDSWTRNPEDAQKTFDLLGRRRNYSGSRALRDVSRTATTTSEGIRKKSSVLRQVHEVSPRKAEQVIL